MSAEDKIKALVVPPATEQQIAQIEASINERATALIKADPVCARLQGQLDILRQISAAEKPEPETVDE